jgi:hypothetical protein
MSAPRVILQQLHDLGARLECREGRLALCAGRRPVPELLVEQARAAKAELLTLLGAENAPNTPKALRTTLDERLREKTLKNAPKSPRNPGSTECAHTDEHLRQDSPEHEHLREHLQQTPEGAQITPRRCSSHEHLRAGQHSCGVEAPPAPKVLTSSCRKSLRDFSASQHPETAGWASSAPAALRAPEEWHEGIALLHPDHPPLDAPSKRWLQFIDDARRLLADGTIAHAVQLGWDALDLFGCDAEAPYARIDQMGLVWLVAGNRVLSISSSAAVIEMRTGSRQTYRRRLSGHGRVLPWDLRQNDGGGATARSCVGSDAGAQRGRARGSAADRRLRCRVR